MINKGLIHPNFVFSDEYNRTTTRQEMCDLIDRWKYLLVNRGAGRGDSLGISIIQVNPNNVALIFAAAELGMKVLLLDKPVCMETVDRTKAALYAPINFVVIDADISKRADYVKMVTDYANTIIKEEEIETSFEMLPEIWGGSDDEFVMCSTSGTTSKPQRILLTQKEIYQESFRNSQVFRYQEDSKVCHTRNLHHLSSMTHFLLPSMMASKYHYFYNIFNEISYFPNWLRETEITHVFFGSAFVVKDLVKYANHPMKVPLTINISGFPLPEEYIQICKDLNVKFDSHYGSVQTGGPTLVNRVDENSVYEPNWLGSPPDDYLRMEIWFDGISVEGPYQGKRIIEDTLREENGKWYYAGRTDRDPREEHLRKKYNSDLNMYGNYVVVWDDAELDEPDYKVHYLDKELWTTETKINVYQLMGYLEKL